VAAVTPGHRSAAR